MRAVLLLTLALSAASAQTGEALRLMERGRRAAEAGDYEQAVSDFRAAIRADPKSLSAKENLAQAFLLLYIPGGQSEENIVLAKQAQDALQAVLEQDARNTFALDSMASLMFTEARYVEAAEWLEKLIAVTPADKRAHYGLGVVAWSRVYRPRMEARAKLGVKPDDPGPIRDPLTREELRGKHIPIIEEGLRHLQTALALDPECDDAMAYMNLLYRERADLASDDATYQQDTATADSWVDKTLATKQAKQERAAISK